MRPVCVDFETEGIEGRPAYPPKPVGVAVQWPGRKAKYLGWGHPTSNNSTLVAARAELSKVWEHPGGVLCHNAKFDLDVAEAHLGLKLPPWQRVHDTMFLLFLENPHSPDLHLKSSAERLLGLPPEEQEAVRDWLLAHQPVPGVKISASPKGKEPWGKYICYAPGDLVGRYACGDVERTTLLFNKIYPTLDEGMRRAYDRERRLLPHVLTMERTGVRVDLEGLERDCALYHDVLERTDQWLYRKLGGTLNLDSGDQLVAALTRTGLVDVKRLPLTPTGKRSTTKAALTGAIDDPVVLAALVYRTQLTTCLETFMDKWLARARRSGGLIYTEWYQTRSTDGGTRTGRFSSSPNFQNIPKVFSPIFRSKTLKDLPEPLWKGMPDLPWVRRYVVPYRAGDVLIDRDYSQQEYRILAHYDDATILQRYRQNPKMDFHEEARVMVSGILGTELDRKPIKNMGFGLLYGMGLGLLAEKMSVSVEVAQKIKRAYLSAVPGIRDMNRDMKERAAQDLPIRTWGGRLYHCEPPRESNGQLRQMDYKLLNVLIQGSAADCTKEALIRFMDMKPSDCTMLITIHDEFLASAPPRSMAMQVLREAMESVEFDVPMISDGKLSPTSWANLEKEAA